MLGHVPIGHKLYVVTRVTSDLAQTLSNLDGRVLGYSIEGVNAPGMECAPPGYEQFWDELGTLTATFPPPFIYIQDVETIRTTFSVVDALLRAIPGSNSPSVRYARVDAIACFTTRLFYETVIHSLIGWEPRWEDGCANWGSEQDIRWNENTDTFLHGLRAAHAHLSQQAVSGKGEENAGQGETGNIRFIIIVEHAERLKEDHPELIVPLTRLAELARLDLAVIFISSVGWEDLRPPLGASPDPYYIDIPSPSKENVTKTLISNFASFCGTTDHILASPYHPKLSSLYTHFITMLCDVCFPFTHDPQELQYIAAARWPGFVKPLIDDYKQRISERNEEEDMDLDEVEFSLPAEDLRIRLIRFFSPSFTTALEALLPRQMNAADWAVKNQPPDNLLSMSRADAAYHQQQQQQQQSESNTVHAGLRSLPKMTKFILIASYLASTNPAKSDLRMFGRGIDEKKRKRRVTKATGKTKSGAPAKIPQRLLGPTAFPMDRMIAILGALLEENDVDSRLTAREFRIPGEYTDMEIGRVGVYSTVAELTSMGLLHRTSPPDRLDTPMLKCAISYEATLVLAKELKVALNDLLWDQV